MVQVVSICLVILVVHHFGDRAGAAALSSSAALLAAFIASALGATRRLVVVADIVEILPEMPHLCVHPVCCCALAFGRRYRRYRMQKLVFIFM